jgi:hypothetical protein
MIAGLPGFTSKFMSQKFYKMLIIGNFQLTILHIPTRGNGGMGYWDFGVVGDIAWLHDCMWISSN